MVTGPRRSRRCQQAAVSRRERFEQHRATRPQQPGDAGRSRAPWPLSHMDSLGPRIPAPNLSPGRRAMCWISAIRSVGWPWDWGFGRWCRPMPSEPLKEAPHGRRPPSGLWWGPTGPCTLSWGGGPGQGEPSPTQPARGGLDIWVLCAYTVCVSECCERWCVSVAVRVYL